MNDGEKAMVAREVPEGWHNLAIGEPGFIQEVFQDYWPEHVCINQIPLTYPSPEGIDLLRNCIDRNDGHDRFVVVTNGAKQALAAALYAAREVANCDSAGAQRPYFPSFSSIAYSLDMTWDPDQEKASKFGHAEILTWPNNPSGMDDTLARSFLHGDFKVWDAVYASPAYGYSREENGEVYGWDCKVDSVSKRYGLSGIRVGWAVFRSKELAEVAAKYVEVTTSGVSIPSQLYALSAMQRIEHNPQRFELLNDEAYRVLCGNASLLRMALRPVLGPVDKTINDQIWNGGLFAWFRPTCDDFAARLEAAKVTMVDGTYCGMPGYWRANVGLRQREMMRACAALAPVMGGRYGGVRGVVK